MRKLYVINPQLLLCLPLWTSRSSALKSSNSISSTCAHFRLFFAFPLPVLFIFNPISYLNRFHLVLRISAGLTPPAGRIYAFLGDAGCVVLTDAFCAASMVCSSAASYSIAIGLTASSEMNRDAKRLCCFETGVDNVGSDVVRLFEVVGLALNVVRCFDVGLLQVCDLNVTPAFDALVLRL